MSIRIRATGAHVVETGGPVGVRVSPDNAMKA